MSLVDPPFFVFENNVQCAVNHLLKKTTTDRNSDWTLLNITFLRETRKKCIGNLDSKHTVQAI